jgi:hypothetical protein
VATLAQWFIIVGLSSTYLGLLVYCRSHRDYED